MIISRKLTTTDRVAALASALSAGTSGPSLATRLRGSESLRAAVTGLGGAGQSIVAMGAVTGTGVLGGSLLANGPVMAAEVVTTGLSTGWVVEGVRVERSERPTQAPKAAAAAVAYGYVHAIGAGTRQFVQQFQADAARKGADATRMRAFRGPEPWSERT